MTKSWVESDIRPRGFPPREPGDLQLIAVQVVYPRPETVHLAVQDGEIDLTPDEAEAWGKALLEAAARVRAARGEARS